MSLVLDFCRIGLLDLEKREVQFERPEILLDQQAYYPSLLEQWRVWLDDFLSQLSTSMESKDLIVAILLIILYATRNFPDVTLTFLQCNFDRLLSPVLENRFFG